jgi:tetratricopeptide (TPR) repeat protein
MRRLLLIGSALVAICCGWAMPATAGDKEQCIYTFLPETAARQELIKACTRLIESKKFRGEDLAQIYAARGFSLSADGQYDRAIADADEIINTILPQRPQAKITSENLHSAYYIRGQSYLYKGDYDRAIADQTVVLQIRSTVSAFQGRGNAYYEKGDFDRAIDDFSAVIREDAKHVLAHSYRARAFEKKGEWAKALADARRAIEMEPNVFSGMNEQLIKRVEPKLAVAGPRVPATPAPVVVAPPAPKPVIAAIPSPARPVVAAPTPSPEQSAASREVRVALVIGNGKYQSATALPNPANDAADVAAALRKLGFDVVEGRDLDKRGMEDKVREFGRKLDRANLALFFYAGHGLQVGGKNYLVPIDAKLERAGDLSFDTIDVAQVLAQMEAEPRVNLIFLDACRDNPLARTLARSLGTRSASVGQGLATIQSAIGTLIAYATQPDNVALDGEGRNSPFTAALLKHVATQGLEIGSVMRRVRADVIQATRSKQVPWDHSSLVGDVVLAR